MKIIACFRKDGNQFEFRSESFSVPNAQEWMDIAVYGELTSGGRLSADTLALLGYAREQADREDRKTDLILIGADGLVEQGRTFYANGADRVFVYEDPQFADLTAEQETALLLHFIDNYKPLLLLLPLSASSGTPLITHLTSRFTSPADPAAAPESALTTESCLPLPPTPSRRGELVICEIP